MFTPHTKSIIDSKRFEKGAWPDSPALATSIMVVEPTATTAMAVASCPSHFLLR